MNYFKQFVYDVMDIILLLRKERPGDVYEHHVTNIMSKVKLKETYFIYYSVILFVNFNIFVTFLRDYN